MMAWPPRAARTGTFDVIRPADAIGAVFVLAGVTLVVGAEPKLRAGESFQQRGPVEVDG
jgi:hypothetical protein